MEIKIIKYTKQIAEQEGYPNVKIKFLKLYTSGKKMTNGTCSNHKNRINFNRLFLFLLEHRKHCGDYRSEVWETMLHEIAHLNKDTEISKPYKLGDLRKEEYINWTHTLTFWIYLRRLRKKYLPLKKQFMEVLS